MHRAALDRAAGALLLLALHPPSLDAREAPALLAPRRLLHVPLECSPVPTAGGHGRAPVRGPQISTGSAAWLREAVDRAFQREQSVGSPGGEVLDLRSPAWSLLDDLFLLRLRQPDLHGVHLQPLAPPDERVLREAEAGRTALARDLAEIERALDRGPLARVHPRAHGPERDLIAPRCFVAPHLDLEVAAPDRADQLARERQGGIRREVRASGGGRRKRERQRARSSEPEHAGLHASRSAPRNASVSLRARYSANAAICPASAAWKAGRASHRSL